MSKPRIVWREALDKDGKLVRLELEVDEAGLLDQLGAKAIKSKGKEAREVGGLVRVRVRRAR